MSNLSPLKRVLVIDDNRDAADLTAELLNMYGYMSVAVYGGAEGVSTALEFVPDFILLDLGMPGMDGYAAAMAMRKEPILEGSFIVAFTAWDDAATHARAFECGFDHHIVKPAKMDDILHMLSSM